MSDPEEQNEEPEVDNPEDAVCVECGCEIDWEFVHKRTYLMAYCCEYVYFCEPIRWRVDCEVSDHHKDEDE